MQYEEYSKLPGLTSSNLGDYAQFGRNTAPEKEAAFFQFGTVAELKLRERFKPIDENYQVVETKPPDSFFKILPEILAGADPAKFFVYTKAGALNKTHANLHEWLDMVASDQIDLSLPFISTADEAIINRMIDNLLGLPLLDKTAGEILERANWSVEHVWKTRNQQKKCLFDALYFVDDEVYHFDLKTSAGSFRSLWYDRYWIQDRHYTEGIEDLAFNKSLKAQDHMRFIVMGKTAPFLAYEATVLPEVIEAGNAAYNQLCEEYRAYEESGFTSTGYLNPKHYTIPRR